MQQHSTRLYILASSSMTCITYIIDLLHVITIRSTHRLLKFCNFILYNLYQFPIYRSMHPCCTPWTRSGCASAHYEVYEVSGGHLSKKITTNNKQIILPVTDITSNQHHPYHTWCPFRLYDIGKICPIPHLPHCNIVHISYCSCLENYCISQQLDIPVILFIYHTCITTNYFHNQSHAIKLHYKISFPPIFRGKLLIEQLSICKRQTESD